MDIHPEMIASWNELLSEYHNFDERHTDSEHEWVFRGQPDCTDRLRTTLERVREQFNVPWAELQDLEDNLLRQFQRRAHHYVGDLPKTDDVFEWLALMRHYGAPTRILDCSYAFFTGVYFAVEEATKDCALWAVDLGWLRKRAEDKFRAEVEDLFERDNNLKSGEFFARVFKRNPPSALVYSVNPLRLNERLTLQQGLFLCPGDITKSFEENFSALQEPGEILNDHLKQFILKTSDPGFKKEIIRHLQRMNINRATLFPGLDGFAKSLNTAVAVREILLMPRRPFTE
jgi:FRG domain